MKNYKEYCKSELDKAKLKSWFDEDGNSVTAIVNRGFIKSAALNVKPLVSDFCDFDIRGLTLHLVSALMFILSPVLFVPLLILRTHFTKRRANKEMMEWYMKNKVDKLHK